MNGEGSRLERGIREWRADLREMIGFLTVLPVDVLHDNPARDITRAWRAAPLAGALIGAAGGGVLLIGWWLALPPLLSATLAVANMVALTGALHEDGLADVADGFGGGTTVERKLEIMRDSRLGSYGALALILALAIRIFAVAGLLDSMGSWQAAVLGVIAAGALSRAAAVALLELLPPARGDGLGYDASGARGAQVRQAQYVALALGGVLLWAAAGLIGSLVVLAVTVLAVRAFASLARQQVGGQTGDVTGAAQQVAEATVLVATLAVIGI